MTQLGEGIAAIASGRLGSVAGPVLAGFLLNSGNGSGFVLLCLLPVAFFAALSAMLLLRCKPPEERALAVARV